MRRWLAFLPVLALVVIAILGALVLLRGGAGQDRFGPSPLIGKPVPAYALKALSGGQAVVPERFAGRAYLINFYASWCTPCRVEHPVLQQLSQAGAPILGVAYKDSEADTAAWIEGLGNPYETIGLDFEGRLALELGVRKVPETFVIDQAGIIVAHRAGPIDAGFVQRVIVPRMQSNADQPAK